MRRLYSAAIGCVQNPVKDERAGHQGCAVGPIDIRQHNGEIRTSDRRLQKRQPVVEIVVAHCRGVIAHVVHRGDHRVRCGQAPFLRHIPQGCALQRIAIVEEQTVRFCRPQPVDERRNTGQAGVASASASR